MADSTQPSLSLLFVSLLFSSVAGQEVCECVWMVVVVNHLVHPSTIKDVLVVCVFFFFFVRSRVVEMIGPMRRLELQAEWRTVWYGTRGKFRCLSHKACMLTLNSESRHQKVSWAVTRVVCAVRESCRSVLVRVCQCLCISFLCGDEGVGKSPAFDCSYTNISNN